MPSAITLFRLGPHRLGPPANVGARFHPLHLAVQPLGEPFLQPPRAQRVVGGRREADRRKAKRSRLLGQAALEIVDGRPIGHDCSCSR
jgi:hypothetical protein